MPILNDPTSPVGNSIQLQKEDVDRLTRNGHQYAAKKAYDLDPGFRQFTDHYMSRASQLDPTTQKRLPELLINKFYYGDWERMKADDYTAMTSQQAAKPSENVFKSIWDYATAPVDLAAGLGVKALGAATGTDVSQTRDVQGLRENLRQTGDIAPAVLGAVGSAAGPLGSAAGTFAGQGINQLTESVLGEQERGAVRQVVDPLVAGTVAGVTHYGINKAMQGLGAGYRAVKGVSSPSGFSPQTKLLADYYRVSPEKILGEIGKSGSDDLTKIHQHLSKAFGKSADDFTTFVEKRLGDAATTADFNAAEMARLDARKLLPDAAQKLVQPKATEKLIQETAQKSPELVKKGGILSKGKILPGKGEQALAETARTIPGFGQTDDVVQNMQVVNQTIGTEAKALESSLRANDAVLPRKQIAGALKKAQKEAISAFGNEKTATSQYQGVLNIWNKISARYPGTTSGQWAARIDFDNELERQFGKRVFDATLERPIHAAVKTIRTVANEQIEQAASKAGNSFLPQIKRMGQMYEILENMSTKVGTSTLKSGTQKFLDSRTGRAALTGAAGAAGAGILYEAIR